MIERTAPNGTIIQFPEGTPEDTINEYLSLDEYKAVEPQTTALPEQERSFLTDIPLQVIGGARDSIQSSINLIEGIGDTLGVGDPNEFDLFTLPEVDAPDTVAGGLIRGVSQFATGFIGVGKFLKPVKAFQKLGSTPKSLIQGAGADFVAFDENSGRFVDMVNQYAPELSNPLFDYLASDPEDTFWEGRFKNAVEGVALGGVAEGIFRTARYIKQKNAEKYSKKKPNEKLLEEDRNFLKGFDENITNFEPKNIPVKTKEQLVKDVEDTFVANFRKAQGKKNRKEFEQSLNADEGFDLGFNARQLVNLDKEGLLTLKTFIPIVRKKLKERKLEIPDKVVENTADKMFGGKTTKMFKAVGKLAKNTDDAPYVMVALNSYYETLTNAIPRLSRLALSKENKDVDNLVNRLIGEWEVLTFNRDQIGENLGRTFRLFGKTSDAKNIDEFVEKVQNIQNAIKSGEIIKGNRKEFYRRISKADARATEKILTAVTKNRTWNIANEFWINALLSNPKTHLINMTSNLVNTFVKPMEQLVGSKLTSDLIENPEMVKAIQQQGQNALDTLAGLKMYLGDAVKYSKLAFKNEDTIISNRSKLDQPVKSIGGTTGKVVRTATRFLNAEDEFFRQINYRAKLYANAIRDASKYGKSKTKIVGKINGKDITEFDEYVNAYFRKGFDADTGLRGIDVDALRYAEESTFTQELYGIFKKVQDASNSHPYLKQIIPFVRTPVNLMLNVVDRTPLALMRKQFRDDFTGASGNPMRTAQVRGQMATGFALITLASIMAKEGMITGGQANALDLPTNSRDLRDLRRNTGFQPYSFRYYDEDEGKFKYIQFGRFDPFGAFFGLVADFSLHHNKLTEEELARVGGDMLIALHRMGENADSNLGVGTQIKNIGKASFSAVSRNLFSKTYLRGLSEFMEAMTDDNPDKMGRFMNQKLGSFYPNVFTKLVNDPFYRDANGLIEEAKKRTGLGAGDVALKYDFRGNPIKGFGSDTFRLVQNVFNPFNYSESSNDVVAEEILRLGYNMPKLRENLNGDINLKFFKNKKGQTAYDRQQEILRDVKVGGLTLDERLRQEINSDFYKRLGEPTQVDKNNKERGGKVKYLTRIIKDYQAIAENTLIQERGNFFSTEDPTGKFTLENSIQNLNINKNILSLGTQPNLKRLEGLYKFSQ
jgi:hypothetical protein